MSKFYNETEEKVCDQITSLLKEWIDAECNNERDPIESLCVLQNTIDWAVEEIMLKIRIYLKMPKKTMGEAI